MGAHPGLLDGWAFKPDHAVLMKADADRLQVVKDAIASIGATTKRDPQPQRARTAYTLTIVGPSDRIAVRGVFNVQVGELVLEKRDLALLCDANLCFGGVVESVRSTLDGARRIITVRLDVYTD